MRRRSGDCDGSTGRRPGRVWAGLLACAALGAIGWQWVERQQDLKREQQRSAAASRAIEQARRLTERAMAEQGRPAIERARLAAAATRSPADPAVDRTASTPIPP